MNERDKIIEIIRKRLTELSGSCQTDDIPLDKKSAEIVKGFAYELADAFIAAGIGDTTNLIVENEVLQRDVDNLMLTLEEGSEEFQEAEHRAQVAERALEYAVSEYRCDECPCIECNAEIRGSLECVDLITKTYKKEAERDIEEEERK